MEQEATQKLQGNKKLLIAVVVIAAVLLIGGIGIFAMTRKPATTQLPGQEQPALLTMSPDEIGLTLSEDAQGHNVIAEIGKPDGISAASFELSYDAKGKVGQGAIGDFEMSKTPVKKSITLGTCSDVCHYDSEVTNIKIVLNVTKDGKNYQVTKSL